MSLRVKTFILLLVAGLAIGAAGDAFARAGGSFSMGSRGTRTYSMPWSTPISPYGASPLQRSIQPSYNQNAFRPGYARSGFGSGLFGGLLGGFLGAGLLGLLFGHGFFGGLGGGFSFIGLLIQIGLLYLLARFLLNLFSHRQPAFYGGPAGSFSDNQGGYGGYGGYGGQASGPPLQLAAQDYDAFERALSEIQAAFSAEDMNRLRMLETPEMASYFAEQLQDNARRGQVNRVSNVKLLQGNLAEAWREGGAEFATVAMRFSLIDLMFNRVTGQIVSGNPNVPDEVTELWTFVRPAGAGADAWRLSAIQQTT